jgi:hypothetical protein
MQTHETVSEEKLRSRLHKARQLLGMNHASYYKKKAMLMSGEAALYILFIVLLGLATPFWIHSLQNTDASAFVSAIKLIFEIELQTSSQLATILAIVLTLLSLLVLGMGLFLRNRRAKNRKLIHAYEVLGNALRLLDHEGPVAH